MVVLMSSYVVVACCVVQVDWMSGAMCYARPVGSQGYTETLAT